MKAVGIILAGGNNDRLGVLTHKRATAAMPIGSCYRSIDFALSNMSNSGFNKVAIMAQYNSRSLNDHISSAKWWDLGRKQGGLFMFSPYLSSDNSLWYQGTADSMYQNISFLKRSNEPYVVITSGDGIYKMDYNELIAVHENSKADVTLVYKTVEGDVRDYGVLELDENGRLLNFEEKPIEPQSNDISLGIYVMQRQLLIKLLETVISEGRYDFVKDVLIRYRKKIYINCHKFDGYWKSIKSIKAYYDINMDFLDRDIRALFTLNYPYIETKPKDEPPAKYNNGAEVKNALIGSGSIINGNVSDSVLFRKVFTGEDTRIKDSIIMEGCYIGNHCIVEHAVLDKEVVLSDGKNLIGTPDAPIIVAKGTVL